jgi:hypothetical protein
VRLDEIMLHETMEDLVRYLVERRVDRLARQGVEDLADDLDRLLGLQLFESAEDREKAIELVTFRNVIAHNRGVVNERLLRLVPNYKKSEEGERLWISGNDFFQATSFLARLVEGVDGRAIKHFKLPSRPGTESLRAMAEAGRKERERQQTERPAEGEPGDEDE